jgi:drug/metabolite transporter (DMT)-like permease
VNLRTFGALLVTLLLWGSAFGGIRAVVPEHYSPGHMALLRFLIASLTLLPITLIRRIKLPEKRDLPRLLLVGFSGITVYHLALNFGEITVDAGTACFLVNLSPVFTALLSLIFLKERIRLFGWLGMLVSMCGVVLISAAKSEGFKLDLGVLAVLGCAVAAAVYFVAQKPLLARYGALAVTAYATWAGTALLLVFLPGLPGAIASAPAKATLTVAYLGVFPAALAYVTWTYVMSKMPASRAATCLYAAPLFAISIGYLWVGDKPGGLALAGGLLAIAGVVIVNTLGKERKQDNGTILTTEAPRHEETS